MSIDKWPKAGYYRITWSAKFKSGSIPGPIFFADGSGFNLWAVLDFPLRPTHKKADVTNMNNWVWSGCPVKFTRYRRFIGRCEFIGNEFPWWLLVDRVVKTKMQFQMGLFDG